MSDVREALIRGLIAKGKTRGQAEASLSLIGSALARRGWIDAPVLTADEESAAVAALTPTDAGHDASGDDGGDAGLAQNGTPGPTTSDESATTSNESGTSTR